MLPEDQIIFVEENPVLLQQALVVDDGYFLSFLLCPPQQSAIPDPTKLRRYATVVLCRRKRAFWTFALLLPLGSLEKQLVRAGASLTSWWRPIQMVAYLWCRVMLIRREKYVRRMVFSSPPIFKFLWANFGSYV